jgi:lipoate synthase
VKQTMADLRAIDVDILTLGQYLQVWYSDPVLLWESLNTLQCTVFNSYHAGFPL